MRPTLLFLFLLPALSARCWPTDPRSLRECVIESKFIVAGRVERVDTQYPVQYTTLLLTDVLRGELPSKRVVLRDFIPEMCPSGPAYVAGAYVLVFLEKPDEKPDDYDFRTYADSYGAVVTDAAGLEVSLRRTREIMDILTIPDEKLRNLRTVEWLVTCVEHPVTRDDATAELLSSSPFMRQYRKEDRAAYNLTLSADQLARMRRALLAKPAEERLHCRLVWLVHEPGDEEIEALLIRELENLPDDELDLIGFYFYELKHRTQNPRAQALIEQVENVPVIEYVEMPYKVPASEKRAWIREFLELVK